MKLEKDLVKQVKNSLSVLKMMGDIEWFSRLNSGKVQTKYGSWIQMCDVDTPDFIAILRDKDKSLCVIFIECKSDTGSLSNGQVKFKNEYDKKKGFYFLELRDIKSLQTFINDLGYNRLNDIEFNLKGN